MPAFTSFVDKDFVEKYWDKKPARLPLGSTQTLCDEQDLLVALKRYSAIPEQLKMSNPLAEFVTGIDCQATKTPVREFATSPEDKTLDSYLARVDGASHGKEWSIAYFGLHGASDVVWDRAKIFIQRLSRQLGFRPGGRVDVDCFVGRYSSTPSGVHVDDAHNFGFTFRAGKTMLTWDPTHEKVKWLKAPAYDIYRKDSVPLPNDPGYVCYFPHDALHVGETKERPSVNVNISFWKESDTSQATQKFVLSRLGNQKVVENRVQKLGALELSTFPAADLRALQEALSNGALETYLAMNDLLEQTTLGLRVPRPDFGAPVLNFTKALHLKESATINWYDSATLEELLIAVNGHILSCPKDRDVLEFLAKITSGSPFVLASMVGAEDSDLAALARQLQDWGAFDEIP